MSIMRLSLVVLIFWEENPTNNFLDQTINNSRQTDDNYDYELM